MISSLKVIIVVIIIISTTIFIAMITITMLSLLSHSFGTSHMYPSRVAYHFKQSLSHRSLFSPEVVALIRANGRRLIFA